MCVCVGLCVCVCVHACVRACVRATHVIFSLEKVWGALAYSTSPCVAMRSAGVESVEWWSHPCHCVCMYAALHYKFRLKNITKNTQSIRTQHESESTCVDAYIDTTLDAYTDTTPSLYMRAPLEIM